MSKIRERKTRGHREKLRDAFVSGSAGSSSDEALLELLLSYAIPRKDLKPLAKKLLKEFGSLSGVLWADFQSLSEIKGIKSHTATLINLVNHIRTYHPPKQKPERHISHEEISQPTLFGLPKEKEEKFAPKEEAKKPVPRKIRARLGSGLFGKAVLKEAISLLPKLPETESLDEVGDFLRKNLHFSGEQTRTRYANYVIGRMFPHGHADKALRAFAVKYKESQELREVCFYRFCKVEKLMMDVVAELLLPSIGNGKLNRSRLRDYLSNRFPTYKNAADCGQAIVDAFVAGGIVKGERTAISFGFREILIPSFAFILHSEFPEPGMYDIAAVETNRPILSMLWSVDRIVPSLYELRNRGWISKVSEIDKIRQFTTKWTLDEVVEQLTIGMKRA